MNRLLMIGLPEAGKTTFLAALWALLNGSTDGTRLGLRRLSEDRTRLETLVEGWLAGEELKRTKLQTEGWADVELVRRADGRALSLSLPDLSGEGFEAQWRDRNCAPTYLEVAREADGVLLFVHATQVVKPLCLTTVMAEARTLGTDMPPQGGKEEPTDGPTSEGACIPSSAPPEQTLKEWNADEAPTQVRLLDLLQILQRPPLGPRRRRLAVLLSAWDLVPCIDGFTPERHLAEELPLLEQYLRANDDLWLTKVFGVSPQGMDHDADGFAEAVGLLPEERIIVQDGIARGYDLTALLDWASADVF